MTTHPILYSFRRCPYAMRARLALLVAGVQVELREVKLSAKPAEMLAASPKGTVPVLVLPKGAIIDESLGIMRWALAQHDPLGWLSRDDPALIAANDGAFKHHLDRYKYPQRHASNPQEHRDAALSLLIQFEREWIDQGRDFGLTDAALFPFVRQFAAVDQEWFDALDMPRLKGWLNTHLASDHFAAAMMRFAPWKSGDAPLLFP